MALANFDLDRLREKIAAAYRADDPLLQRFRDYARRLEAGIRPLRPYAANAVSFVSADGGDNRITFNPSVVELVRVGDSRGNEHALDAIASSVDPRALDQRGVLGAASVVAPLARLCERLNLPVSGLSYLLGGLGQAGKSTGAMRA